MEALANFFKTHTQSKTVVGLVIILGLAASLCVYGKLTPEMVDVIKYVGSAFMLVRGVANYGDTKTP